MSFNHTCLLLAMEMASKHTRTVENNFGNPKKRLHENDPPRKNHKRKHHRRRNRKNKKKK